MARIGGSPGAALFGNGLNVMNLRVRLLIWSLLIALTPMACRAQVIISEFMADNKDVLADEDGENSDWIELYNTAATNVNLAGWSLRDSNNRWYFPATNVIAKGYLVVFASGKNRNTVGAPLHTDFALRASGEYLGLLRPDGSIASEFSPAFPEQEADVSYGLAQEVATNWLVRAGASGRVFVPTNSTLGTTWTARTFNDSSWAAATTGIGYETAVPGFAVYNYLANVGVCSYSAAESVIANPAQQLAVFAENPAVINYVNASGSSHYGNDSPFPGLTLGGDTDNFAIEATATIYIPAAGNWTFGVNSDDGFSLSIGSFGMSYPDPRSPGDSLQTFNFPAAGNYALKLVFYECGGGACVELWAAQGSYTIWDAGNFRLVGDTLNGGLAVTAPVVSGGSGGLSYSSLISTDLQSSMSGVNASVYLRMPFYVTNTAMVQSLTFRAKYDDGMAIWINGQKVDSRNAPASPVWNSTATNSHPNALGLAYEEINLSDRLGTLVNGTNVLAIQGLNIAATDTDFLLLPELLEYQSTNSAYRYFSAPSPGSINAGGAIAIVADTKFSVDRGFFDTPFSLAITSATTSATIIYTTNGSIPSLTNGLVYTGPIAVNGTTVIRAAAFREGYLPSDVDTQTYLFLSDVIRQSANGAAPPGWPTSWGANVVDYGMDPDVINNSLYSAGIIDDLKSIPTYSLVTELSNLFDPATGIYANPRQDGIAWERPASLELIYPDGTEGFQVDAGVRIRGGFSRDTSNPKHAFRLFFRAEYGASKLQYPVFDRQGGADTFDAFDLRCSQNYSWSYQGDSRHIALRDQFSRDAQLAQGQPAERGDFYHLYINGQYWGLYNTCERPEASYGEAYFGGNQEDYDVVKVDTEAGYTIYATDGDLNAWLRLWMAATNGFANDADYFKVQGLNVDGTPNPAYENLLDVDNLIDHMLVIFFGGNLDAPISNFLGNNNPNNFWAIRNRTGLFGGFRFIAHDSEHTLLVDDLSRDRTGPFPAGDPVQQGAAAAFARSNPQYVFTRLTANSEFRLRVADHVQKQFFNGGWLTTEACRSRFLSRSNEIQRAIVGESARWGDAKSATPFTRNTHWVNEMNRVYTTYFAQRPSIVLDQLRAKSLYPAVTAPSFNQFGGLVTNGFTVTMTAPAGTIYYTRDGSDPRLRGGGVSQTAVAYTGPVLLNQSTTFKARVLSGSSWSALAECSFYIIRDFTGLLVTEVMYHPPDTALLDGDEYEFIELKNVSGTSLDLSGVQFTNGINYRFPVGKVLAPGAFLVLAGNASAFTNKYPGVRLDGTYEGRLSNSGERLTMVHATGNPLFTVSYGTRPPWPALADGGGFSMVTANPNLNPDPENALNWRASTGIGGSPGADDAPSNIPQIVINEALTHTDPPQLDTVELYNPYGTNVSLAGWYLTDDRTVPKKYRITADKQLGSYGYLLLTENDWNADPGSTNSFRLDSHGEEIYLYSADTNGNLTGYSDGLAFGAARNGVSFGRYTNSIGEVQFPAQTLNTLPGGNAGPRVGPVVINEIHYHPAVGGDEFIELKSITNTTMNLYDELFPTNTWRLNGAGYSFPQGAQIEANGLALVVGSDPAAFRTKYGVPANVPIFGPYWGTLQGSGETLSLQFPDHPDVDTNTGTIFVPYIDMDVVRYNDKAPWPTNADGGGASLERLRADRYGNDPVNWRASPGTPSPGLDNTGNRPPLVNAGPDLVITSSNAPIPVLLTGTAVDDGLPASLQVTWSWISGPAPVWFSAAGQPATTAYVPGVGTYTLRLTANDGSVQVTDDVMLTIERARSPVTLVSRGSNWRYLDDGTDQGTAWRERTFSDGAWPSGPAPLGYGDANGQWPATTNSYGGTASWKHITYYYRHSFNVSNPTSLTNLLLSVQRDDGVIVFLNGTGVFTNNMPLGVPISYLTNAVNGVGSADETMFYSGQVSPALLRAGTNVLAAEIHQVNRTSTDIVFDCGFTGEGYPANQGPSVNAGVDQAITLPASASLAATVTDDGLPVPPGLLTFSWNKVSGPGTVSFFNAALPRTTASFSAPGTYVLSFIANDGSALATDQVVVTVNDASQPPEITSVTVAGTPPMLRLQFTASAGLTYTVQYRNSLALGSWLTLTNVPAQSTSRIIEITDSGIANSATRYYRVTSP